MLRLWWYPHNDFGLQVGLATSALPALHRFFVVAGLVGLTWLAAIRPLVLVLLLPPLAISAILALVPNVETRYIVPVMPLIIIGAAFTIVRCGQLLQCFVWPGVTTAMLPPSTNRWVLVIGALASAVALLTLLGAPMILQAYGHVSAVATPILMVALCILVGIGWLLTLRLLPPRWTSRALATLTAMVMLATGLLSHQEWVPRRWVATLSQPGDALIQRISRSETDDLDKEFSVLIDLEALDGDLTSISVGVNGHDVPAASDRNAWLRITQTQLPWYYSRYFLSSRGARDVGRIAQWVALPVPRELIVPGDNEIRLTLRQSDSVRGPIRVYGQPFPTGAQELSLPSLFLTSYSRYMHDGEPRPTSRVMLTSSARESWIATPGARSSGALTETRTPVDGGTFNIILAGLSPADRYVPPGTPQMVAVVDGLRHGDATSDFWFVATGTDDVHVSLWDGVHQIMRWVPGAITQGEMSATGAKVTFFPLGSDEIRGPHLAAVNATPQGTKDAKLPDSPQQTGQTGLYVVRLEGSAGANGLHFKVRPRPSDIGTSWHQLFPRRLNDPGAIPPISEMSRIGITASSFRVMYAGEPSPNRRSIANGPHFFALHTSVQPGTDEAILHVQTQLGLSAGDASLRGIVAPWRWPDTSIGDALYYGVSLTNDQLEAPQEVSISLE